MILIMGSCIEDVKRSQFSLQYPMQLSGFSPVSEQKLACAQSFEVGVVRHGMLSNLQDKLQKPCYEKQSLQPRCKKLTKIQLVTYLVIFVARSQKLCKQRTGYFHLLTEILNLSSF